MLAFRFCVVVSGGAIAILGYGANAARATLPQGESPSIGAFAESLSAEASDSHLDASVPFETPSSSRGRGELETNSSEMSSRDVVRNALRDRETAFAQPREIDDSSTPSSLFSKESEISQNTTKFAIAERTPTAPTPPQEEPRPGSGATDSSSDDDSNSSPPSSHPRRERPIAGDLQYPQKTANTAETTAAPSPTVALSNSTEAANPDPQLILEAFEGAIGENSNIRPIENSVAAPETAAPNPTSPEEKTSLLQAFKDVVARFEGVERAVATEDPIFPQQTASAVADPSFEGENFVPFERILSHFKQVNSATEPVSVLATEQAIPVSANLLNPRSLLEAFEQFTGESSSEAPREETPSPNPSLHAASPTPQTVVEAFASAFEGTSPDTSTFAAQAPPAPIERIFGTFNRVAPNSTARPSSETESLEPNNSGATRPTFEPLISLEEIADAPDTTAWIAEFEVSQLTTVNMERVETDSEMSVAPALSEDPSEAISMETTEVTTGDTPSEATAPPELAPRTPQTDAILTAFADAIAQTPPTANRISVDVVLSQEDTDVAQNVNPPVEGQPSFTPFERILTHFRLYAPSQTASPNEAPAADGELRPVERDLFESEFASEGVVPSPRSLLNAFQQTLLNPPPIAQSIPLPVELQTPPPVPVGPEIGQPIPVIPPTPQVPLQPAATLGAVEPPNPLHSNSNSLLFPTQSEEVEIDIAQPITLLQAIELARRNNPTLETVRIELEAAREDLREALAAEYPTLSTQFDVTRTDSAQQSLNDFSQNPQFAGLNDTITSSANAQLELNYNLLTGGRRTAQIQAAEDAIRFNQLAVERQSEQTRFEVTRAYYNLQEADARVGIEQAAIADAEGTLRDAQLLEEAGLGTRFDVLRAEVDLANSRQNFVNAVSQQLTSRRELATSLGLPQDAIVFAADRIGKAGEWELPLEETIVLAYKNRAELEQQLVQRDISAQQREVALSSIRPQVNLFANYNFLGIIDDDRDIADGYSVGARLQWTLFDGGAARARAAREEKNIELAETRFDEQRNQIRLEVEQAYNTLSANEDNIQTANIALQLAQESLRLARLRFGAGVGTQTEVINAQTELTRARGNLLTAIISYNQSLAALQRAVSNLPDNRLFDLP
ncbi:MAG: TolC family protein [Cyanobacteriota bacterium]|nr:TolC family protein [Cyanobacteriota bacterium]